MLHTRTAHDLALESFIRRIEYLLSAFFFECGPFTGFLYDLGTREPSPVLVSACAFEAADRHDFAHATFRSPRISCFICLSTSHTSLSSSTVRRRARGLRVFDWSSSRVTVICAERIISVVPASASSA